MKTATFLILWRVLVVETTGPGEEAEHGARSAGHALAPYGACVGTAGPQAALDGVGRAQRGSQAWAVCCQRHHRGVRTAAQGEPAGMAEKTNNLQSKDQQSLV